MVGTENTNRETLMETDPNPQETSSTEAQSYLISKYREALKKGDKNAAKSCLMAARYFTVNDPCINYEIYIMAKSDGDAGEASKCFTNMFNDLFLSGTTSSPKISQVELTSVTNQMKEEIRILIHELKSRFLKLNTRSNLKQPETSPTSNMNEEVILKPKVQLAPDDVALSQKLMSKLDVHLNSNTKSPFYQQLFDQLHSDAKKNILNYSIEGCEDTIEQCKLMMLATTLCNDTVVVYGKRLFKSLVDLMQNDKTNATETTEAKQNCQHAESLLVLDAIPLLLDVTDPVGLNVTFSQLFEYVLNFYSTNCLELYAQEYEPSKLYEGVKKAIASQILGTGYNYTSPGVVSEDNLVASLDLMSQHFIETVTDTNIKKRLTNLRLFISDKTGTNLKYERFMELIKELNLDDDIPDDVLFPADENDITPIVTPTPKVRGRPRKHVQPLPSTFSELDDEAKKNLQNKVNEIQFVFFSLVQYVFVNCTNYLKSTRSRVLVTVDNPLALQIEIELSKTSIQRTSRSKVNSQQSTGTVDKPTKKVKMTDEAENQTPQLRHNKEKSPLSSEQSKLLDKAIIASLTEAKKLIDFLESGSSVLSKLWQRFVTLNDINNSYWYQRISVDALIISGQYIEIVESFNLKTKKFKTKVSENGINLEDTESTASVKSFNSKGQRVLELRNLVQLLSCYVQTCNKSETYRTIEELLLQLKECDLLNEDENCSGENLVNEYMTVVRCNDRDNLGFLFFDSWSLVRHCTNLVMDILKRCISSSSVSDTALGHTIALSQFDWPKEISRYNQSISWILCHKPKSTTPQTLSASTKFTYPEFFQYIRHPNIIEDFMALLCRGYTLDIKSNNSNNVSPTSSQQPRTKNTSPSSTGSRGGSSITAPRSGKAITTRGVNKTVKEDLKVALVAQMRNSSTSMSLNRVSDFLLNTLLAYLNTVPK